VLKLFDNFNNRKNSSKDSLALYFFGPICLSREDRNRFMLIVTTAVIISTME